MKHRRLIITLSVLFCICFVLFALCFSIERVAYDNTFYYQQMDQLNTQDKLGVSSTDMHKIIDHTVDYISGKKDDFHLTVTVYDQEIEVYNEREIQHMEDVNVLFRICETAKYVCLVLSVLLLMIILCAGGTQALRLWALTCLWTLLAIVLLVGVLIVWSLLDFHSFWTVFHKISFSNDLWLMEATDRMIIMFPSEFFAAVVGRIITVLSAFIGGLLLAVLAALLFITKKRGRSFG